MRVFTSLAGLPADFGPSAVTIGKFDGVHRGHRAVIDQLHSAADTRGLVSTVVTFDRNPLALLVPEKCPEYLLSPQQKLEHLERAGVEAVLVIPFDRAFSQRSPEGFAADVLGGALDARLVLVGEDFRYGARGAGTVDSLRASGAELGFEVELIGDVSLDDHAGPADDRSRGRRASSSWVREALAAGDVREAAAVLGYVPAVRSVVVAGEKRGRELGFPTANLSAAGIEGMIPADGVYAGWLSLDGRAFPAAISVGNNPTFKGVPERQVEAHLLDQDIDLYGKTVEVAFTERLRGMVAFDSVDALVAQLHDDVAATRRLLDPS